MGRYYQKYFEDYEENRVPNKWGNGTHLQYTYKGFYYRQELNKRMQIALRICYGMLFLLELHFFAKAGTGIISCNANPVMALLQSLSMLCYVWLGWILFFYVSAPRDMTIYKYRSTALQLLKAQKLSVGLSIGMLLAAAVLTIASNGFSGSKSGSQVSASSQPTIWAFSLKQSSFRTASDQKGMVCIQ